jgi:hypothetical protein
LPLDPAKEPPILAEFRLLGLDLQQISDLHR